MPRHTQGNTSRDTASERTVSAQAAVAQHDLGDYQERRNQTGCPAAQHNPHTQSIIEAKGPEGQNRRRLPHGAIAWEAVQSYYFASSSSYRKPTVQAFQTKREFKMSLTPEQVLKKLSTYGITSLDELAERVSKQTVAHDQFLKAMDRDIPEGEETDYTWTGPNYSLHHAI
jgi:hypothetical protein